jgi:hypothetical protein
MRPPNRDAVARARATASETSRNNWSCKDKRGRGNGQVERPFEIWTTKFDGSSRFYQAYDDAKIAEGVRDRLKGIGLDCEIRFASRRATSR